MKFGTELVDSMLIKTLQALELAIVYDVQCIWYVYDMLPIWTANTVFDEVTHNIVFSCYMSGSYN